MANFLTLMLQLTILHDLVQIHISMCSLCIAVGIAVLPYVEACIHIVTSLAPLSLLSTAIFMNFENAVVIVGNILTIVL